MSTTHRPLRVAVYVCLVLSLVAAVTMLRPESRIGNEAIANAIENLATEKVMVIMVDGLRLQESYKASETTRSLRPPVNYTPRLTDELFPLGTLYRDAKTGVFNSTTTSCTNTLMTGTWQEGPNRGRGLELDEEDFVDNRSLDRTMLEQARITLGLAQDEVAFITDKLNTRISDHSYHPGAGSAFSPTYASFITRFNGTEPLGEETFVDPLDNSMVEVLDVARGLMDSSAPDLMFLCLGLVDIAGHRAVRQDLSDYELYTESITVFDELLVDFWNEVQMHPDYGGKTTMILCADHGRHEDHNVRSFGEHTGTCDGTREIILFTIGPDSPQGLEVNRRVYQTSIAPTAARMLGIELPESADQPLYEALGLTSGLEIQPFIRNTEIAIDPNGVLVAAYRRTDRGGNHQIAVQRKPPGASSFESPVVLQTHRWRSPQFLDYPTIVTDGPDIHVAAWRWNDSQRAKGVNHEYLYWKSSDAGVSFTTDPAVLTTGRLEDTESGYASLGQAELHVSGNKDIFYVPTIQYPTSGNQSVIVRLSSAEFGSPDPEKVPEDTISDVRRVGHHRWLDILEGSAGTTYGTYAILQVPTDPDITPFRATWEIYAKDFSATGGSTPAWRLTDNNSVPDLQPSSAIETDGPEDRIHLVYATLTQSEGWQLVATTSTDLVNGTFTPRMQITSGPEESWEPDILYHDGIVHVVYTRFDTTPQGEIYYLRLLNGSPITLPLNLSNTAGESRNPRVVLDPDETKIHVVWEEASANEGYRLEHVFLNL